MTEHVYKITEVVGSSSQGIEQAVENAVQEAAQSLRQIRWVEVTDIRADVNKELIAHWQVTVKIGFTMETSI
ncbi:MAG: dodecin family protein [Salinisphaera sp.]|nr:dodecin family protein [Salinisphaera sp.]MDN5939915.1 dodecin family protein [Salinisphaera sp.]